MNNKTQDDFFGVCPTCKSNDGYLNVGRAHFFICHAHRVKWCRGENLFSSWQSETEEHWKRNEQILSLYQDVEPISSEQASETGSTPHCSSFVCDMAKKKKQPVASHTCSEHVSATVRKAIVEVIEYAWDEELRHFLDQASRDAATNIEGHFFATLCELRTYFEGRKHDPRFYLARAADPDPITAETQFVIDRVRDVVFDAQSQEYVGEVVQTSVGRLRDKTGVVVGLEVIHSCKGKDGEEFCIDSSVFY